jgi:hypothetical protein
LPITSQPPIGAFFTLFEGEGVTFKGGVLPGDRVFLSFGYFRNTTGIPRKHIFTPFKKEKFYGRSAVQSRLTLLNKIFLSIPPEEAGNYHNAFHIYTGDWRSIDIFYREEILE